VKIDWKPFIIFRPCEVPETAERSIVENGHEMHLCFINLPGKFAQYKPAGKRRPLKIEVYHGDSEEGKMITSLLQKS
jgi:hypothetical protein